MDVLHLHGLHILWKISEISKEMFRMLRTGLVALLALTLVGCGGSSPTTATPLTNFTVAAMVGYAPIVPDEFNITRLPEGVEVYFWVGGSAYEVRPMGGFGTIGGYATGSFYKNNAVGRQDSSYTPVAIPFTHQRDGYNLYRPVNGEYIVTASFPFRGQTKTTPPLHFTVGPYSLGQ
jgi:hypothetical protein